jgi:hypothetical protein
LVDQCDNCDNMRQRTYGPKQVMECRVGGPTAQGHLAIWPEVKAADWCALYEALGHAPEETYLQGSVSVVDTTQILLFNVGGDTSYTVATLIGYQITNTGTKVSRVIFYDGLNGPVISQVGCTASQSIQGSFNPPVAAKSGSVYVALDSATSAIYVSAQGQKRRP